MTAPTTTAAVYTSDFDIPKTKESSVPPERSWSLAQRVGFRFVFIYVLLYTFPGPIDELPGTDWIGNATGWLTRATVPWFGSHVLGMAKPISLQPSGSGDRMFNWVLVAMQLAVAIVGAIIWSLVDRRRKSHPKLFAAFHLYLRFTLGAILLGYGFDKIFPNQFESINPVRLTQYIGEAAPGGFAWFFLGFSAPYVIFAGAGETIAGLLLFFRRTTTLGAIIGGAVLTNVFALNMAYDIPVKQFSFHLLLFAAFLVACDAQRMLNVLIRNQPTDARVETPVFTTPRAKRLATVFGSLLVLWIIGSDMKRENEGLHQFGRLAPRNPLWGIYEVEQISRNGVTQQPLLSDRTYWKRLAVRNGMGSVRFATDSLVRYGMRVDSVKHTVRFLTGPDTTKHLTFAYSFPDSTHFELHGRVAADSVVMRFTRRAESSYLLVGRGFHWVNETPYFR